MDHHLLRKLLVGALLGLVALTAACPPPPWAWRERRGERYERRDDHRDERHDDRGERHERRDDHRDERRERRD